MKDFNNISYLNKIPLELITMIVKFVSSEMNNQNSILNLTFSNFFF